MTGSNVFAEEIYFRGFLLERLKFLGNFAFVVNGILFIGYHVFQIPITYPLIPFGLLIISKSRGQSKANPKELK